MMKVLAIFILTIKAVYSWNTCTDESFCETIRNQEEHLTYQVRSVTYDLYNLQAELFSDDSVNTLTLSIVAIEEDIFRIIIDDPINPRQAVPQALDGDPVLTEIDVNETEDIVTITSSNNLAIVELSPFRIEIYADDTLILIINDQNRMVYNFGEDNLAIAMDFVFPEATTAYGIPLHAESLELQTTGVGGLEPYRLYNVDHCCYNNFIQDSLYGAEPVLYGHSTERTTAIFWLNAAQTFVDISRDDGALQSYFMSESGIMDIFVLTGPDFKGAVRQYMMLTGPAPLPQLFTLGYHQSRWSYTTQEFAEEVVDELDNNDFPFDAIWFDVDYMDGKRSFTWNYTAFPDPVGMQEYINSTGRKTILIIDPHYKVEEGYYVYDIAAANGYFVKYENGSDFQAEGWPDLSSWWDFINPQAAEYYSTLYSMETFVNTTNSVYVWNDMNEPEVFDGLERSWNRSLVFHNGDIPNTDVHNIYGFSQVRSTYNGFLARYENSKRPFILSRSHFSGSQRYTIVWTGDNNSTWDHLQISFPMCLSLAISGISFCGADIGGFAGNLTDQLYQRWYQAGAWLPFYRAHSSQYEGRREPFLYSEEVQERIRNAIRQRYYYIPLWYTLFYEHERYGEPVIRPLVYEYPFDVNTHGIDNQWLVGANVLVHPVAQEDASSVEIYFPGGEDEVWFDIDGNWYNGAGYETIPVTLDSTPVYFRGGSIVSRKEIHRPSTAYMNSDPYNIYVYLDINQEAAGTLYIDDYESFEYRNSLYNYYEILYDDGSLVISKIDEAADYAEGSFDIETIQIYSTSETIKEAVVNDDKRYQVSYTHNTYVRFNFNITVDKYLRIEFM